MGAIQMSATADRTPRAPLEPDTRIRTALTIGQTFSRAQVADLISRAFLSGMEHAGDHAYARGRRDAVAEHVERSLDQLARAVTAPAFSADDAARGIAQRQRRELADTGGLQIDSPPPKWRPLRPGVPEGCTPRNAREAAAITVDPECEWPPVAVPGGGA